MAGKSEYHRDSPTLTDSLEFADYLQALGSIVNRAETPLTVGVFGTWGAGKTSLMKMLNLFGELIDGDIARAREAAEQVTNPAEEDSAAQQLLAIMREVEDPPPARERVAAGLGLGLLGDPRREVLEPEKIEWIEIPAGPFYFELNGGQFEIPYDYRILRYPVTNSQFGKFREARGDHDWKDYGAPFNLPNHPVVRVSWHAALAFAEWLTELLRSEGTMASNEEVRLPSEPEWEKACPAPLCTPPVRVRRSQSQAGPPLLRAPPCSGRGCRASGRFP